MQEEEAKRCKRRRQREARGGGKERQEEEAKRGKRRRQREARGGKERQEEEAKRGNWRWQREARGGGKERQEGCLVWVLGKSEDTTSSLLGRKIQLNAAFGGLLVVVMASLTPFVFLAVGTETTNGGRN